MSAIQLGYTFSTIDPISGSLRTLTSLVPTRCGAFCEIRRTIRRENRQRQARGQHRPLPLPDLAALEAYQRPSARTTKQ